MTNALRVPALLLFLLCALSVPSFARAETLPQPIVKMSDALEETPSNHSDLTANMTIFEDGKRALTVGAKAKGSVDADTGNVSGKANLSFEGDFLSQFFKKKKLSTTVDFVYMHEREEVYFRVSKFPKLDLIDFKKAAKRWIVADAEEFDFLSGGMTDSPILTNFADVQRKYPAFNFTEKGSTKKEYVYSYTVDTALLPAFVNEHRRLEGEDPLSYEELQMIGYHQSIRGTVYINKTSYLPTRLTTFVAEQGDDRSIMDMDVKYTYGKKVTVKKPSGAMPFEDVVKLFEF